MQTTWPNACMTVDNTVYAETTLGKIYLRVHRNRKQPNLLASLDVESLFTNVPLTDTLDIIKNDMY